ncbi:MAG TPA: APH(6)-I family aminoglycoside O-phosphotransferase [Caulobacter sp.]|nr:APH(6)-I family aminoglycoside O-phosphotransferase [Caulobacter sp.]
MPPQPILPADVAYWLQRWLLEPDGPLMTTHSSWVLPVRLDADTAMLKVARIPDEQAGYRLMSWWGGQGAATVLASDDRALLLERGLGPLSLPDMARAGRDDEATRILCDTAARLHAFRPQAVPALHPLDLWFRPLFDLAPNHEALAPAAQIARGLLASQRDIRPLHGDLHHGNVLDFEDRGWLAIDPHGLIGERTFDFANIFTNPDLDDPTHPVATLAGRLEARLAIVVQETGVEPTRILEWIAAWTGLSAAWFIGDGDARGAEIDLIINAQARRLLHS